jgi:aldehyde dehydrogenase (NAD+)
MVLNPGIQSIFLQQQAYTVLLRSTDTAVRLKLLNRLEDAVKTNREKIYQALKSDLNKSETEADLTELLPVFKEIHFFKKNLKKWMSPFTVPTPVALTGTGSSYRFEPKGVCLIISPWNYPINLTLCPLVAALAAGNTVIIKPSERSPVCSELLKRMIESAFEPKEAIVFTGDGTLGAALLELPFNHIFFTGSAATGRSILEKAAQHLSSTTLELGGKSPTIIDESADIKKAASRIAWSKMINNGQTCIAPDYLLLNKTIKDSFLEALKKEVAAYYQDGGEAVCRLIDKRQEEKIADFLKDLPPNVLCLPLGEKTKWDQPALTLVIDPPTDTLIMKEEIFGPLLPVIIYQSLEEAIAFIQNKPKPLSLYIYSSSKKNIQKVLRETSSGGVVINMGLIHFVNPELPFGGVNYSGIGKAHGFYGFQAFSNQKSILEQHLFLGTAEVFSPPYRNWKKKLIKFIIKYL